MSFFTKAATTALAGCVIFGFASAASAHHMRQQPFVKANVNALLRVVKATGHRIYSGGELCEKRKLMGAAFRDKQLLVCVDNHKGDLDELADTVRHEVIHLAQMCKARRVGATSAVLVPNVIEESVAFAQEHLHWNRLGYNRSKWNTEGEARTMAHFLNESQVAELLVDECKGEY